MLEGRSCGYNVVEFVENGVQFVLVEEVVCRSRRLLSSFVAIAAAAQKRPEAALKWNATGPSVTSGVSALSSFVSFCPLSSSFMSSFVAL
jgi:hypothetical protein